MAPLEYCFAASADVEETPAYSRPACKHVDVYSLECRVRRQNPTNYALSFSSFSSKASSDRESWQCNTRSPLRDFLDADQLRPAAKIPPASMRQIQTREEVVPRGDNPRHVLPMRCQTKPATWIIFGKAPLSCSVSEKPRLQLHLPACAGSGFDTRSRTRCPGMKGGKK